MKDEIQKPKSLSDLITAATLFINKTAYKTGMFLYGATTPPNHPNPTTNSHTHYTSNSDKCDLPLDRLHPDDAAEIEKNALAQPLPVADEKEDDEFTKGLMKVEADLSAMRTAWEQAQDDVERNALRFKLLRLERARNDYLAKHLKD